MKKLKKNWKKRKRTRKGLNIKNLFAFNRWETMQKQLLDWNIDLRFYYITDASKVYKDDSWKNFVENLNKKLKNKSTLQ